MIVLAGWDILHRTNFMSIKTFLLSNQIGLPYVMLLLQ